MTRIAALMLFLFGLTIVAPLSAGAQQGARAYRFELGLNLETARALALVIPPAVRLRADYIAE